MTETLSLENSEEISYFKWLFPGQETIHTIVQVFKLF